MTDPNLTRNYDRFSWHEGKGHARKLFKNPKNCSPLRDAPLVGMVGRMTYQKGTDLVVQIAKNLLNMPIQLAILGSGDAALRERCRAIGRLYADRIWVNIGFNGRRAHEVLCGL